MPADLKAGTYRPLPARRVWMPKPGSTEQRPLSIPAVRDRIVQAAHVFLDACRGRHLRYVCGTA